MLRAFRHLHIRQWHESPVVVDRKSRFQARNVPISDAGEIPAVLAQFLAQHKNAAKNASHPHILAWRTADMVPAKDVLGRTGKKSDKAKAPERLSPQNVQQGFKDNGEKGAGQKMLDFMVSHDIYNRVFFVTRWYGGTPLGPSRFRHIVSCCSESLRRVDG